MRARAHWTALAVAMCSLPGQVRAQLVNGGGPNGQVGWNIFNGTRSADDFFLATPMDLRSIRFWGIQSGGLRPTEIFWEILRDDQGLPGKVAAGGLTLAHNQLVGPANTPGLFEVRFDLDVGSWALDQGHYWLALHDGPMAHVAQADLFWGATSQPGPSSFAVEDLGIWTGGWDGSLAFQLAGRGTVTPEPATAGLLGMGLIGVIGTALRRRRALAVGLITATAACGERPPLAPGPSGHAALALSPGDLAGITAALDDAAARVLPSLDANDAGLVAGAFRSLADAIDVGSPGQLLDAVNVATALLATISVNSSDDVGPDVTTLSLTLRSIETVALHRDSRP